MRAGNLNERIAIYSEKEQSPNTYGQRKKTYQFASYTRAEVSFLNASESISMMEFADKTLKFKVHFKYKGYSERQMILYRGQFYNIRAINNDRKRKYSILEADRILTASLKVYDENQQIINSIDLENDTIDLKKIVIQL